MFEVDLHLHTTFSDGRLTPTQMVDLVASRGLKYVSITDHFQELLKGLIDTKDLVYFATVLVVSLFLTQRSVESVRWR